MLRIAVPAAHGQAARPPDDSQLKAYLMEEFIAIDGYDSDNTRQLKAGGVTDEQLRRVLVEIYAEAGAALKRAEDEYGRMASALRRENAVRELGSCTCENTKTFLLEVAADKTEDGILRTIAVGSYLRAADAGEARDILLRFLVGDDRMDLGGRTSICSHAQTAFMEADAAKRAAILESLYVGLSQEENKCNFHVYDDILSELSSDYVHSHQRLAILEKLIDAPPLCKADEFVMPNLMKKLKELQKTRRTTNINTNLSALKKRDFNQPLPEEERSALETPPDAPDAGGTAQEEQAETRRKGLCPLAAVAGLLAAIALWLGLRKKRGSA
jgi:hypothetical protein